MSQARFNVVGQIFSKGLVDRAKRKGVLKNDEVDFVFMVPMAVAVRKRNDGNWAKLGVDREIYFLVVGDIAKIVNKEGVCLGEMPVERETGKTVDGAQYKEKPSTFDEETLRKSIALEVAAHLMHEDFEFLKQLPNGFLFNEPLFAKRVEGELDNILEELSIGKIDSRSANAALKNYKKNEKIHDKAVKTIKKRMAEASKAVESELKESIHAMEKAEKIKGKQGELDVK